MKKHYAFLFLALALFGLAFTRFQKKPELSVYRTEATAVNPADSTACDTISFNARIAPLLYKHCAGCHEGISDFKSASEYGEHILKTLTGDGAPQMQKDAAPLPDSVIREFSCWIKQGKLNN